MRGLGGPRPPSDPPQRRVDHVLFDLDNTLVPFIPALHAWADECARGLAPLRRAPALARLLAREALADGEDPRGALERVVPRWNLDGSRLNVVAARAHQTYLGALAPYAGVPLLLGSLRHEGVGITVVTDAPTERAHERLKTARLSHHFDMVITREDTHRGKHGPEPFHLALRHSGTAPTRTAVVGDWPAFDVRWPKKMGMRTVLAGWGCPPSRRWRDPEERPWAVAERPEDVVELLTGEVVHDTQRVTLDGMKPLWAF